MISFDTSIASSPRGFTPLSHDDLRRIAPSVFAESAGPGVSSRYTFVSTVQVVDLLRAEGWEPVKANQQRTRLEGRKGFQMHEIRFARREELSVAKFTVGSCRPELILQNSHDGTRAYRIDAGIYRLVCRNGLTVADADFAHIAIRHLDVSAEKFAAAAQAVADNTPRVIEVIARWQAVSLTPLARQNFVVRAMALRWNSEHPVRQLLNPRELLTPARYGDQGSDLWTTLNVVQERLCRGGLRYVGRIPAKGTAGPTHYTRNTTRPVGSLTAGQKLNKALWELAADFAQN